MLFRSLCLRVVPCTHFVRATLPSLPMIYSTWYSGNFIGITSANYGYTTRPDHPYNCGNLIEFGAGKQLHVHVGILGTPADEWRYGLHIYDPAKQPYSSGVLGNLPAKPGTQCLAGTVPNTAGDACVSCAAGKSRSTTATCTLCPRGYAQPDTGKSYCNQCGAGQFAEAEQSSTCTSCAINTFSGDVGRTTACATCAAGRTTNGQNGRNSCEECESGRSGVGCVECVAGKYRGPTDSYSATCIDCPEGYVNDAAGRASCQACSIGTFQNSPGQQACENCAINTFSGDVGRTTTCATCSAGRTTNGQNSRQFCDECESGRSGEGCVECIAGKYRGSAGE